MKEVGNDCLLKSVSLIANFFKNPLIVIMMTAALLSAVRKELALVQFPVMLSFPQSHPLKANPQQLMVYKNHHFHLRSSWAVHSNQISNQAIPDAMRSLTLHYGKALPVTLLSQCLLKEEPTLSKTALKNRYIVDADLMQQLDGERERDILNCSSVCSWVKQDFHLNSLGQPITLISLAS